jgi:hypothetical protein
VARNRCELTPEGCKALDRLLKLVYPKGHTEVALSADTGLTRDTLDKIFEMLYRNAQKSVKPVQYIKFEQLFDRLNSKLDDQDKDQHKFQPRYCAEVDRLIQPKRPQHLPVVDGSPVKQLDTSLRTLNYTTGQASFNESLKRLKPAGAFLLQVNDTRVQRWLVKRLAQEVVGFENGRRLEINVACLGGNFESLWSEFARQLKLPDGTAETTIARLSELCQGKTVIIVLSRLQQLDKEMQQRLIGEFWIPLVRQISSQHSQSQNWRSRLVLFMVQDGARAEVFPNCPFRVVLPSAAKSPDHPVRLEPLIEFALEDVRDWFEREGANLLATLIGAEEAERFMQQDSISTWEQHPWATLENICNVFRTEIDNIEPYWKLAG